MYVVVAVVEVMVGWMDGWMMLWKWVNGMCGVVVVWCGSVRDGRWFFLCRRMYFYVVVMERRCMG